MSNMHGSKGSCKDTCTQMHTPSQAAPVTRALVYIMPCSQGSIDVARVVLGVVQAMPQPIALHGCGPVLKNLCWLVATPKEANHVEGHPALRQTYT